MYLKQVLKLYIEPKKDFKNNCKLNKIYLLLTLKEKILAVINNEDV